MPININGFNPNSANGLRPKTENAAKSQPAAPSQPVAPNQQDKAQSRDQVSFSSQARDLKQLESDLKRLPEVDQDRVAKIKAALADGSYKIDNEKLAGKLLGFEEETR